MEFWGFLSQFSTNFHEILHTLSVCDITARPSPVILAPDEYTVSPTGPAGRVYTLKPYQLMQRY